MTTSPTGRTYLAFQHDGDLSTLQVTVQSVFPAGDLDDASRAAFKGVIFTEDDYVVVTDQTLFHPQGGGQPSDTGTMTNDNSSFSVSAVRMGAPSSPLALRVLHLGNFGSSSLFASGTAVTQNLDTAQRLLFSKYHTAGHVLGSAVRHVCEASIPNFDELKANHFPATASCEFQGLIDGKYRAVIQQQVDDFVARDMQVQIEFWSEDDFRTQGLERLLPDPAVREALGMLPDDKFRIVRIKGAEVYPCGGTHVPSTAACGKITAKKISRQKGMSKVSYSVE